MLSGWRENAGGHTPRNPFHTGVVGFCDEHEHAGIGYWDRTETEIDFYPHLFVIKYIRFQFIYIQITNVFLIQHFINLKFLIRNVFSQMGLLSVYGNQFLQEKRLIQHVREFL